MSPSGPTLAFQQQTLSVQINQIDHTLIQPGPLDNSSLPRVPVIRIYGVSSVGKKACVHIHQVYPYFFVEYNGKLDSSHVNRYVSKLTHSLNHAIALSLKRDPKSPNSKYIRAIFLVKGVHFYGFHSSYSPFLKISVANPAYVNRIVTIMQSGIVMSTRFRVFESHLSYILQFMCDFGLYGCGWIELGDALQRNADDSYTDQDQDQGQKNSNMGEIHFSSSPYHRQSRMPLELDAVAPQILNRHYVTARNLHHKIEIPAPPLPTEPLVLSVRELWEDERRRRRARGLNPSPEIPVDPSDSSRGKGGDWVSEARWWEELRKRIEKEREEIVAVKSDSEHWENWTMTTYESIETLWDENWKVWKPTRGNYNQNAGKTNSEKPEEPLKSSKVPKWNTLEAPLEEDRNDVDVDVSVLSNQEMNDLEETEWERLQGDDDRHIGDEDEDDGHENDAEYSNGDERLLPASQADLNLSGRSPLHDPFLQDNKGCGTAREKEYSLSSPPQFPRLNFGARPRDPVTPTQSEYISETVLTPESPTPTKKAVPISSVVDDTGLNRPLATAIRDSAGSQPLRHNDCSSRLELAAGASLRVSTLPDDQPRPSKRRNLGLSTYHEGPQGPFSPSSPSPSAVVLSRPRTLAKILRVSHAFRSLKIPNLNKYGYALPPPTVSDLLGSLDVTDIPSKIYNVPYYSRVYDVPGRPREYAGLLYNIKGGGGVTSLEEWDGTSCAHSGWQGHGIGSMSPLNSDGVGGWEYAGCPPSIKEAKRWLLSDEGISRMHVEHPKARSQIEGPTQANIYAMRNTLEGEHFNTSREKERMTLLSLEIFTPTREEKVPDAENDVIAAAFYTYRVAEDDSTQTGIIAVRATQFDTRQLHTSEVEVVQTELDLINRVVDIVVDLDPDIIVGWEVQRASWGYLDARGQQYGFDVAELISRAPISRLGGSDEWEIRHTSTFKVAGRHVLNLWRIMRSEQTLTSYTFENVVFNVLQRRLPRYTFSTLTEWYHSKVPAHIAYIIRYFSERTTLVLEILDKSEIITKTAEFARVFGVDFFSVISRGSQFKVESFMFRIAKPESFVLLSPSKHDVGKQNAAECMPLIMEPRSAFYTSPLVVLDFQSLYPSIMIAYNYCYSTCLGRVKDFKGRNKLGVVDLDHPPGMLETLSDHIHGEESKTLKSNIYFLAMQYLPTVAPNGIMYVKPEVRKGLLGRMLVELLETRVMVKQAMKGAANDKALRRILDARQLSLKYICNVTYGYTGATYSGRMPAVEIADSIVQSGRETLEKAIMLINATKKWGAENKVVYGDTDSVFVYLRGKTKEQAFRIGADIADTITAMNPAPVKLKFEKVYLPCVLMAKKRYVGFKYEHIDEKDPVFDAKGIETVRRDGVSAQQKMTEKCLKILFRTQDLSEVKDYCYESWTKLLENKASIQDFIFAKEVRMGTYSDKVPPPPGVTVAARRMVEDPNNEPQYGERVPYVITRGPNTRLVDRAMDPLELLHNSHLHLDAIYYISRVLIPPLERIFNLVGADVRRWFAEMPKMTYFESMSPTKARDKLGISDRLNIDEHFRSSQCLICGEPASEGLCDNCCLAPQVTMASLSRRIQASEKRLVNAHRICATCTGSGPGIPIRCESLDCPWLYSRKRAENKREFLAVVQQLLDELNDGLETDSLSEADTP